ncbi:MAG: AMP-binding protein [Candidatus Thermoplasmatota archaeon]
MPWLNIGEAISVNAAKYPGRLAVKDARRALTAQEYEKRTNKLANGLLRGLEKGDKIAILSNNSVEFMEVYAAAAKAGLVVVPLNFRLPPDDINFIIGNSDAKMLLVEERFREEAAKSLDTAALEVVPIGGQDAGWACYEEIVAQGEDTPPSVKVRPEDAWVILYTSGTTGRPKGVVRSHRSYVAFFLVNEAEFSFTPQDYGMILMPLSHVNSTFYSFVFTYLGAPVYVHREYNYNPEEVLRIIDGEKITFTSMIPTHYNLILNLPEEVKRRYDLSSIRTLLTSSAPATKEMKLKVMELFRGVRLFEAYGSTEAGLVTLLRPEDQMSKLGSIGKECIGTDRILLLDEEGNPVPPGEVGELYSRSPQIFDEYYKMPDKTKEAFRGGLFSAGDMAVKDKDGFYYLVDRKANMIITGGEHVFPSEVEKVILSHPAVLECAVVGLQDPKWGEAVTAVCVLREGMAPSAPLEEEIRQFCDGRMARFKKPKRVLFLSEGEMPKTASGKIVHRLLRERLQGM